MRNLWAFVEVLRALWHFYQKWRDYKRTQAIKEALKKDLALKHATEKAKKAKTDEEIMDSQRDIVDSSN